MHGCPWGHVNNPLTLMLSHFIKQSGCKFFLSLLSNHISCNLFDYWHTKVGGTGTSSCLVVISDYFAHIYTKLFLCSFVFIHPLWFYLLNYVVNKYGHNGREYIWCFSGGVHFSLKRKLHDKVLCAWNQLYFKWCKWGSSLSLV